MKRKKMLPVLLPICLLSLILACGEFQDLERSNPYDPEFPKGTLTGAAIITQGGDNSGIIISVTGTRYSAVTNPDGEFIIPRIPVGIYEITAYKPNYEKVKQSGIAVEENQVTTLSDILLAAGTITGKVIREGEINHIGIIVSVDYTSYTTMTDNEGNFRITGVPTGFDYYITAFYPDLEPYHWGPYDIEEGQTIVLPDGILKILTGSIVGVALLQGEIDHSGIRVTLSEPGYSATTNASGDFMISGIPAQVGGYALTATKDNYNPAQKSDITVVANQQNYVGILQLSPKNGSISGLITKELGDDPEGTIISLEGTALTTSTSSTGAYLLTPVPPGIYNLIAVPREERYLTGRIEGIPVEPGIPTTDVNLVLQTSPLPPIVEYSTPMSSSSIAVTWSPNPEETQGIKGYNVYYRTATELYYTMANPSFGGATPSTYTITGLTRGTQYFFKVTAVDDSPLELESAYSQEEIYQFIYPLETFPTPEISLPNSLSGQPRDIALYADGITTKIYVTTSDDNVYVIDPITDTVITIITAGSFQLLTRGIAANPAQGEVYVADTSTDLISVIEVATDTVTSSFSVGGNLNPVGILFYSSNASTSNDFIFVANQGASGGLGDIRIFDADTKALLNTLDYTPFGKYASGMVIANGKLYVANGNGTNVTGSISVVECTKGSITSATTGSITSATITSSIKVGLQDRTFPTPMAVSADEKYVYVVNNNTDPIGTVSVIDTDMDEVITTLGVGIRPRGITSVGDIVYVVSYTEVNISVIDTRVNQVLSCSDYCDIQPGGRPLLTTATPDGNKIYVINQDSTYYNISVFDYNY